MERKVVEFADRSSLETKLRGSMDNWPLHESSMEGEKRVMREKRLYDASLSGSVESLNKLMQEDKLTLARVLSISCFNETPLHVAAMLGHLDFAKALLNYKPDLVTELDSHGCSPLHLASSNGYTEMVKYLLTVDSSVCLTRDENIRTPLHLAVMKGRVDIINELVRARSEVTQYTLDRGETILHTCVIYNRLNALKLLVELIEVDDFVNFKDDNDNTILHTVTSLKQIETMKYLISRTEVKVNAVNGNGFTALDIIEHMPRDFKSMEIRELLVMTGALRAKNIPKTACKNDQVTRQFTQNEISLSSVEDQEAVAQPPSVSNSITKPKPTWFKKKRAWLNKKRKSLMKRLKKKHTWVEKKRDALMVAATVIAAMAYQAGLNPPGGVWQDDEVTVNNRNISDVAGTSIMAVHDPDNYPFFWKFNTLSFVSSLSIILLLVSGLPMNQRIFMWLLMVTMWATLTFMAMTYIISMQVITPALWNEEFGLDSWETIFKVIKNSVLAWLGVILVIFLVHTCRFIWWIIKKVKQNIRKLKGKCKKQNVSGNANEGDQVQGETNV